MAESATAASHQGESASSACIGLSSTALMKSLKAVGRTVEQVDDAGHESIERRCEREVPSPVEGNVAASG